MRQKKLSELLQDIISANQFKLTDVLITDLSLDSRAIKQGSLFIAYPGTVTDGRNFITQAITEGCSAILYESKDASAFEQPEHIPCIPIENLQEKIGLIAANFYDNPSKQLTLIGVTGTNGKTSCSHFIAQCLNWHGYRCAVIGTIGNGFIGHLEIPTHTTPNPIALQAMLANFLANGATHVAMEVSSHALSQNRVAQIEFDVAVFTNLTQDHLDYHVTMANYAAAKQKLFAFNSVNDCVINADDHFGQQLIEQFHQQKSVIAYSMQAERALTDNIKKLQASHLHLSMQGISATLSLDEKVGLLHSSLLGRFNLANLLAVFGTITCLGVPFEAGLDYLSRLRSVAGRMEMIGGQQQPLVIVDYAHTPDALQKLLETVSEHCEGNIWCVFGCGGERDVAKRPQMGRIAEQLADFLIITDDNPRHENPVVIVEHILAGLQEPVKAVIEHDRKRAIEHAIQCAKANDMVLIAGKGHETYQQINDQKNPFNDALIAKMILAELNND